ncbi:MAG: polysaccharide pyruvyl transferase family protein [Verrucomicrobiota bacterium]
MKIGIIGFYHQLNAGDDRFMAVWTRLLFGHDLTFITHTHACRPDFLRSFDLLVIGGGGMVIDDYGVWHALPGLLRRRPPPMLIAGLEINRVATNYLPSLRRLLEHCLMISLRQAPRDPEVAAMAAACGATIDTDLAWVHPLRVERRPSPGRIAFNLAPCHWQPFEPADWRQSARELDIEPWPLCFGKNDDRLPLGLAEGTLRPAEFDTTPLQRCEFVVAARYHALVFALQNAVPCIGIAYDHKVARLMKSFGLDAHLLPLSEPEGLPRAITELRDASPGLSDRIRDHADRHVATAAVMAERIRTCVAEVDAARSPRRFSRFPFLFRG